MSPSRNLIHRWISIAEHQLVSDLSHIGRVTGSMAPSSRIGSETRAAEPPLGFNPLISIFKKPYTATTNAVAYSPNEHKLSQTCLSKSFLQAGRKLRVWNLSSKTSRNHQHMLLQAFLQSNHKVCKTPHAIGTQILHPWRMIPPREYLGNA